MLTVRGLQAWRGGAQVLRGVDFHLAEGEVLALLGRNGSGRSTLAQALLGLLPWRGEVAWQGRSLAGLPTHRLVRLGIGYVPEGRDVFAGLTVRQNLQLGTWPGQGPARWWDAPRAFAMFPELAARADTAADLLSGGEQQMLALARTLMGEPRLLVIDEPTEGLSPQRVEAVASCLRLLRQRGLAILLVEQKLPLALAVADRALLLGQGQVQFSGTPARLRDDPALLAQWLAP